MKFLLTLIVGLCCAFEATAVPIGAMNHAAYNKDTNSWIVTGWACEPGQMGRVTVNISLDGVLVSSALTTEPNEIEVSNACSGNPATPHRFRVSFSAPPNGQQLTLTAHSNPATPGTLVGSGQAGLPNAPHPLQVMSTSTRLLIVTAHPDDEVLFAPTLRALCHPSSGRVCTIFVATKGVAGAWGFDRAQEMRQSAAQFPLQVVQEILSDTPTYARTTQEVLDDWNADLPYKLQSMLGGTQPPDVVLTLDPRHGTSCHTEHRAIGKAVHAAVAQGTSGFPMNRLFFLTTRRAGYGLYPNAPYDKNSVVYQASTSDWDFTRELLRAHPSQFGLNEQHQFDQSILDQAVVNAGAVHEVGSSRVDLQACKLEYSIVSPK